MMIIDTERKVIANLRHQNKINVKFWKSIHLYIRHCFYFQFSKIYFFSYNYFFKFSNCKKNNILSNKNFVDNMYCIKVIWASFEKLYIKEFLKLGYKN